MKINNSAFSNVRTEWRDISLAILANILTTVLLHFYTELEWYWLLAIIVNLILICLVVIVFFNYRNKLKKLNSYGINSLLIGKEKPTFKDYGEIPMGNFYFWGISAKRVIAEPGIQKKLIEIGNSGFEIRILLMNPQSPNLQRKAEDENANHLVWEKEIQSVIDTIKHFGQVNKINIQLKVYDEFPVWRLIIMNNTIMHLTYFLTAKQGIESPMFVLNKRSDDSLFQPLFIEFNEVWNYRSTTA